VSNPPIFRPFPSRARPGGLLRPPFQSLDSSQLCACSASVRAHVCACTQGCNLPRIAMQFQCTFTDDYMRRFSLHIGPQATLVREGFSRKSLHTDSFGPSDRTTTPALSAARDTHSAGVTDVAGREQPPIPRRVPARGRPGGCSRPSVPRCRAHSSCDRAVLCSAYTPQDGSRKYIGSSPRTQRRLSLPWRSEPRWYGRARPRQHFARLCSPLTRC
jgi:hypothetical protein